MTRENNNCPNFFATLQISNFKPSTVLNVINHDKMNILELASIEILMKISFNKTYLSEFASPQSDHNSKSLNVDKLTTLSKPSQQVTGSRQANKLVFAETNTTPDTEIIKSLDKQIFLSYGLHEAI